MQGTLISQIKRKVHLFYLQKAVVAAIYTNFCSPKLGVVFSDI